MFDWIYILIVIMSIITSLVSFVNAHDYYDSDNGKKMLLYKIAITSLVVGLLTSIYIYCFFFSSWKYSSQIYYPLQIIKCSDGASIQVIETQFGEINITKTFGETFPDGTKILVKERNLHAQGITWTPTDKYELEVAAPTGK
jgi:hypothetical protein